MRATAPPVTRNVTSGWEETGQAGRQTHLYVLHHTPIALLHLYNTSFAIKFIQVKLQRRGFYKHINEPSHSEPINHDAQTPELSKYWLYAHSKSQMQTLLQDSGFWSQYPGTHL